MTGHDKAQDGSRSGDPYELLTIREVTALTKLSRTTIWRRVSEGTFPRPIRVGPRAVRWLRWQVEEWIASRPLA